MDRQRKSVLDALVTKENKAVSSVFGSSSLAPPPKRKRLVRARSLEGEKDAEVVVAAEEVQHYGNTFCQSLLADHPAGENVDDAENVGINKSHVTDAGMNKIGEFNHPAHKFVALFNPQPYIPQENRLVTIEDSALADSHIGFVLATSITPPEDLKKLQAIKTAHLECQSF